MFDGSCKFYIDAFLYWVEKFPSICSLLSFFLKDQDLMLDFGIFCIYSDDHVEFT